MKHLTLSTLGLALVLLGVAYLSVKFFLPLFAQYL